MKLLTEQQRERLDLYEKLMRLDKPIGILLAARLATRFDLSTYAPVDAADKLSARPDVAGLIYPVVSFRQDIA
ncbi:alpha/beta hydrolase, partial [bacterium]|nr:alpha/beta hydrolase [bacterium]